MCLRVSKWLLHVYSDCPSDQLVCYVELRVFVIFIGSFPVHVFCLHCWTVTSLWVLLEVLCNHYKIGAILVFNCQGGDCDILSYCDQLMNIYYLVSIFLYCTIIGMILCYVMLLSFSCTVLQCIAVYYNISQCVTICCNVL